MILILADAPDAHADAVETHLRKRNAAYFRLNLDVESLRNAKIHYEGDQWLIEQNGLLVEAERIRAIWARRLTVSLDLEQRTTTEDTSFRIWRSEWNRCLYGLYANLRQRFWMNPIAQAALMDNKYYQMTIAKQHGFAVPDTVSSNYAEKLRIFANKNDYVALKFMSQEIYKMPDGTYTGVYVNKIQEHDLSDFGEEGENPITLQAYIPKDFEVRYTVVGGEHFVCKIESQKSQRSAVDWRRYDIPNTPHSAIKAPDDVSQRIEMFMNDAGLTYGALDFIVDPGGTWWYLEVNSAGQWLWVEDLAGLPISATIANLLDAESRGARI